MPKTHTLDPNGFLTVVHDNGENPDGSAARDQWNVPPSQLARHAPMFEPEMTPGDRSAFQDAVREAERKAQGR
jgi:hypothetical protein